MQFIPSTWRKWGTDANGDGRADPGPRGCRQRRRPLLCRAAADLTLGTEGVIGRASPTTPTRPTSGSWEPVSRPWPATSRSAGSAPPPSRLHRRRWRTSLRTPAGRARGDRERPHAPAPPQRPSLMSGSSEPGPHDVNHRAGDDRPGECAGPTLALDPRAGFLRCGPTGGALLDPCEGRALRRHARRLPPDPTGTPVLLRLAGPAPTASSGARRRTGCWSWTAAIAACPYPRPSQPGRHPRSTTTAPDGRRTTRTRRRPRAARPPRRHPRRGRPPRDVSRVDHDHGDDRRVRLRLRRRSGAAVGTERTRRRRAWAAPKAKAPSTAKAPTISHLGAATTSTPTTTIPLAERPTYASRGGATSSAPNSSSPTWVVLVRQTGLADRQLVVVQALS